MKKIIFGAIIGVAGTIIVQKIYRKHGKLYHFVNNDLNKFKESIKETETVSNVLDRFTLIIRRMKYILSK
jgi:hypothetical protein